MFGTGYLVSPDCMDLEDICNDYSLNIFSDASMDFYLKYKIGSFGAIAVYKEDIIDNSYFFENNPDTTTVNRCEAKGLRLALRLAIKYARNFAFINLFSDSLLTVNTIRSYIGKWFYDKQQGLLYTGNNKVASNQDIHIENLLLLNELLSINPNIRIYHQNGHINERSEASIDKAFSNFKLYNNIPGYIWVDRRIIKYISRYNNIIDKTTRERLREVNYKYQYNDPIVFHATQEYNNPELMSCYQMQYTDPEHEEIE